MKDMNALHFTALSDVQDDAVVELACAAMQNVVDTFGKLPADGVMRAKHCAVYRGSLEGLLSVRGCSEVAFKWYAARGVKP